MSPRSPTATRRTRRGGCPFQAWSLGELIRAERLVGTAPAPPCQETQSMTASRWSQPMNRRRSAGCPHRSGHRRRATPRRRADRQGLAPLGAVSQRAAVGHGARGLQRGRQCLGLFPARPCAQPRLSLGRGRHRRLRRRAAAAVPRRSRSGTAAIRSSRSGCSA